MARIAAWTRLVSTPVGLPGLAVTPFALEQWNLTSEDLGAVSALRLSASGEPVPQPGRHLVDLVESSAVSLVEAATGVRRARGTFPDRHPVPWDVALGHAGRLVLLVNVVPPAAPATRLDWFQDSELVLLQFLRQDA
ncbi:hypothetical protein GCM10025783_17730 [Amnibacterium soli]|uniref:Uncharacterized protein n=1 Tax=Amnibacterium soli TaxID=1282736 RepID=A0ABP8Z4G5_9MICO